MRWLAWAVVLAGLLVLAVVYSNREKMASRPSPAMSDRTGGSARVFLILRGDRGRQGAAVGCGDSLIGYSLRGSHEKAPLAGSLKALLALPAVPATPARTYNALGRSSLRLVSADVDKGVAHIVLAGKLRLEGGCDAARAAAQLQATALQFPRVRSVRITLDGKRLERLLPQRG